MAAELLHSIECSSQPLDFSFHPSKDIVALALVDGTVELHDFSPRPENLKEKSSVKHKEDDDDSDDEDEKDSEDEDEFDSIMSSIPVHSDEIPIRTTTSDNKDDSTGADNNSKPIVTKSLGFGFMSSSCRSIVISSDGNNIYTAGNGGGLCCLDFEQACNLSATVESCQKWRIDRASPFGINRLYQLPSHPSIIITGDDEGTIRIWDTSICGTNPPKIKTTGKSSDDNNKKIPFDGLMKKDNEKHEPLPYGCLMSFSNNRDYISKFEMYDNTLLVTSSDGTLSAYNLNVEKGIGSTSLIKQSDEQEDELTSVVVMKNGRKVVCGSQMGVLSVWSFGTWGDVSDRFPGHPQSIDSLLKIDEDTLLTGCGDGFIRAVQIHPDKLLGVIGGDHGGFPVEVLRFTPNRKLLGSISHDDILRLWDASILKEDDDSNDNESNSDGDEENNDDDDSGHDDVKQKSAIVAKTPAKDNSDDEWEDEESSDDDDKGNDDKDEDDSDDDSWDNDRHKKRARTFKTETEQFFSDL